MSSDLLHSVISNVWVMFMVVLLFGGSIFVHELGHFLAARRRGVHVERFSIGFGPAIWSWRGRDGVEYRLSWIPLGGYVLLPQLADLSTVEGESRVDVRQLPPVSYTTKMIVFVAGAAFNILFAFVLACIVWKIGRPVATGINSTTVADVMPTIKKTDGHEVVSPAVKAGLKSGDVIIAVDGDEVQSFNDIVEHLALSSGWSDGRRQTIFTIRRNGETLQLPVQPEISGSEKLRMVGFTTVAKLVVGRVTPGSLAERAKLQIDDQIIAIDGKPTLSVTQLIEGLRGTSTQPLEITVLRAGKNETLQVERPTEIPKEGFDPGITLKTGFVIAHPSPFQQVGECVIKTFRTLGALLNPRSDIGISHLSGPIGIISNFVDVSRAGLPFALWFTILVNVNLAILNLLPMPVLDGGQMLFATIARLRGRALPTNFVMAAQSVFFVLIFAFIGYISVFVDVPRINRERAADAPPPKSAPAK